MVMLCYLANEDESRFNCSAVTIEMKRIYLCTFALSGSAHQERFLRLLWIYLCFNVCAFLLRDFSFRHYSISDSMLVCEQSNS